MPAIPEDFLIGAATAAYQIEGGVDEDGRGPSIWDVFCREPGRIHGGDTGDVAADHYHRYADDVREMQALGLDAYRFSIAWPRLYPNGDSRLNERGLDFYQRLAESLLDAGIRPFATLFHWDLPAALQERGGWANRDTALRFADYAHTVFRRLGSLIPHFITLNEPGTYTLMGHVLGEHAPGLQSLETAVAVSHHLLLGHGFAVQAFRAENLPGAQIGLTNVLSPVRPKTGAAADRAAAARVDAVSNRWFLEPVLHRRYPDLLREAGVDRVVQPGDFAIVSQPIDFLGVNYYRSTIASASPSDPLLGASMEEPGQTRTAMGWGVDPDGLHQLLLDLHAEAPNLPVYITENGAAYPDVLTGRDVHDANRVAFLREHLEAALAARAAGADVRGWFVWSLLDNFEWAFGYSKRFGVLYVDYPTQARIWKDSARWLQSVCQRRRTEG
ncbi:MAG: beta-glucosidase [Alicyclobacillus sp.]|nr:beta-glucosidase [Alicyclobacillus sp.]